MHSNDSFSWQTTSLLWWTGVLFGLMWTASKCSEIFETLFIVANYGTASYGLYAIHTRRIFEFFKNVISIERNGVLIARNVVTCKLNFVFLFKCYSQSQKMLQWSHLVLVHKPATWKIRGITDNRFPSFSAKNFWFVSVGVELVPSTQSV